MILRSGLIQNLPGVDHDVFSRHWRDIHGPLAANLPNLRGYVQNHIVSRGHTREDLVHRIDGISQLWFESVDAMQDGMTSPEQDACVVDISGFLERATIAVQSPGNWITVSDGEASSKLMAVYVGEASVSELAAGIAAATNFAPAKYRINFVVEGEFMVAPTVARSHAHISAVLEAYFVSDDARRRVLETDALDDGANYTAAAVLAVSPYIFIPPPA